MGLKIGTSKKIRQMKYCNIFLTLLTATYLYGFSTVTILDVDSCWITKQIKHCSYKSPIKTIYIA